MQPINYNKKQFFIEKFHNNTLCSECGLQGKYHDTISHLFKPLKIYRGINNCGDNGMSPFDVTDRNVPA